MKKLSLFILIFLSATYMVACTSMGANPDSKRVTRFKTSPQYNFEEERFQNPNPRPLFSSDRSQWDIFKEFFFGDQVRRPPAKLPEVIPTQEQLAQKSQAVRFIWFGHSTILLEMEGKRILFDPIFSKYASPIPGIVKRFQAPVMQLEEIQDIDVVIISHDHYDHLDHKTINQLMQRDIHFIVPLGVAAHLQYWGVEEQRISELDWWEETNYQGLKFIATPSQHFSGRGLLNGNSTLWASWVVQGTEQKVYFSGDTGYSEHYKAIGDRLGPFDLAFLENGAYNEAWKYVHQLPEEGVQASIDLKSRAMIPIHWGMFDLSIHSWHEPIERVTRVAKEKGVTLIAPKLGQIVSTEEVYQQESWWQALINWTMS
jgi:L-ascorbate metabolism protein UlaG (beta-lactamase superfamily)